MKYKRKALVSICCGIYSETMELAKKGLNDILGQPLTHAHTYAQNYKEKPKEDKGVLCSWTSWYNHFKVGIFLVQRLSIWHLMSSPQFFLSNKGGH